MISIKKSSKDKRANLPTAYDYTKSFLNDWEELSKSGRYDMNRLKTAMLLLIGADAPLPPEYLDHPLKHNWKGFRECHIGGDFLLIYELRDNERAVIFTRAGTHASLFR